MSICQIYDLCAETLWLGRYGESGARDIAIDVGRWFADLGTEGTVVLVNWRPGEDDTPYNPNVTMDGSMVVWSPSSIDLAISGRGFAELRYYVGNALAKSKTFRTVIDRTPSEGANPPSAAEDWLERMEDAAVTAQTASETAVDAAETATEGAQAVAQALPTVTQAAQTATSAATTATNAATEAAASEEVASVAANAAQTASESATAASQTAVSAATTATTKATQAVEAAGTATTKASEAAQAATTATANAQTSTAKAGEATTAAATATSKATEATTAASTASAAATTATGAASTATSAASAATAAKAAAQTAQTGAETAQTAAESAAASVSASAAQIATNTSDITALKADLNTVVSPNLMGHDAVEYFPVDIVGGTTLTISTSDGSVFPTDVDLRIQLFDANYTQIDYFALKNGQTSRTIATSTSKATTKYLRWNRLPSVPLMVNVGDVAQPYQEYFPPLIDQIAERPSLTNLVGLEANVLYPVDLAVGGIVTMSTADREYLGQSELKLFMYDENKNDVSAGGYNFTSNARYRTITYNGTVPVKYFSWNKIPVKEVQVEYGSKVSDYVPYALNIINENVIHKALVGIEVTDDNLREKTFNASYHTGATDFATKCAQFSSLMYGDTIAEVTAPKDCESFLFFTDPHLLMWSRWEQECYEFIAQIQKYYNSTPTTFCLCGGDWLGNDDLPSTACYKMGYIDGFMHSMFNNVYMLVGNHDTNYQGKLTSESARFTTRLSNQSIIDLWYREQKKAYFSFSGANTKFYAFDTGIESQALTAFDNYGWEQVAWFANAMLSDDSEHIAITAHILYYNYDASDLSQGIQPLMDNVLKIAQAYNNRTSITVNGTTYDYSSRTGKVEFCIGGHTHADAIGTLYGIPFVLTLNVRNNVSLGASFDLVFVDYDNSKIELVRVGAGEDRTVSLT